jgi:CDP-glycerol glycerophosphotransferase (TagB/SpsB family)
LANALIRRNDRIWLFGAWMGTKFADNPRFLFQYLHENRQRHGVQKVVWTTNSLDVYKTLEHLKYHVCMSNSFASIYYHLRAGVHVICNVPATNASYKGDILGQFSFGAKKVQLWHGTGIKATGYASTEYYNKRKSKFSSLYMIKERLLCSERLSRLISPGGWTDCYFLSSSELNAKANRITSGNVFARYFISCYPRDCLCEKTTDRERYIIEKILHYRKRIIYLPTFRKNYDDFMHPFIDDELGAYIQKEEICWIEKAHSVSTYRFKHTDENKNILLLESEYDINTLYQYIDILISDYSSAILDAVNRRIPVITYLPDKRNFNKSDFLFENCSYGIEANSTNELRQAIVCCMEDNFFSEERESIYADVKRIFFSTYTHTYSKFMDDLEKAIKIAD